MLIEQIIKFEFKGAWAPWLYMYFYNRLFSWQNKNFLGKYSSGLLFTAKILQKAKYLISPYLAAGLNHLHNLTQNARF